MIFKTKDTVINTSNVSYITVNSGFSGIGYYLRLIFVSQEKCHVYDMTKDLKIKPAYVDDRENNTLILKTDMQEKSKIIEQKITDGLANMFDGSGVLDLNSYCLAILDEYDMLDKK